ncbi:MAG: phosphatase domain-containing protein [Actinomycetes bacterium]
MSDAVADLNTANESDDDTSSTGVSVLVSRSLRAIGDAATTATTTVGDKLDATLRGARTARAVSDLDRRISAFRRERKIGKGTLRATFTVAFRGFVSGGQAHFQVRVLEEPVIPQASAALTDPKVLRTNLRRFVALAFPGVKVSVLLNGIAGEGITDRHGYAAIHLPAADLAPGWHEYHVVTVPVDPSEKPSFTTGEVIAPDPAAPFAVISDVDDTVLRTGLTEGFAAVRRTLLGSPETRRAIPGMAELYAGLREGLRQQHPPAFFYVSTGPWTLYDMLVEFLEIRGFPKGALFLTDWGPQERYVMRSGREHKRLTISRLFAAFPETRFILIGDSGQHDPDTYVEAARNYPGCVDSIFIIDVGEHLAERALELHGWNESLAAEGITFNFVGNAAEAARILAERELVPNSVVAEVEQAISGANAG